MVIQVSPSPPIGGVQGFFRGRFTPCGPATDKQILQTTSRILWFLRTIFCRYILWTICDFINSWIWWLRTFWKRSWVVTFWMYRLLFLNFFLGLRGELGKGSVLHCIDQMKDYYWSAGSIDWGRGGERRGRREAWWVAPPGPKMVCKWSRV